MNEILDEVDTKENSKTFSLLASGFMLLTIVVVLLSLRYFNEHSQDTISNIPPPPKLFSYALKLATLGGIICTILSFVRKEPSTIFKWLGLVFYSLTFLFLMVGFFFVRDFLYLLPQG